MTKVNYLQQLIKSFDAFAAEQLTHDHPKSLYEPIHYLMGIGGKRLRPAALMMVNDIYSGQKAAAMHAALSVEWFHNFTLMHDDIMDGSQLRRNQATTHIKFGSNAAILSGDLMLIQSIQQMNIAARLSNTSDLLGLMLMTAEEVCIGQAVDMDMEKSSSEVNMDSYLEMIKLKTAVLLAASMQIGAQLNHVAEDICLQWYQLGINIGLMFQLQDDYLDFYGESESFGKLKGGDILQSKKSALIVESWPLMSDEDKSYYNAIPVSKEEGLDKLKRVGEWFDKYNVQTKIQQRIASFEKQIKSNLENLKLTQEQNSLLQFFMDSIIGRVV